MSTSDEDPPAQSPQLPIEMTAIPPASSPAVPISSPNPRIYIPLSEPSGSSSTPPFPRSVAPVFLNQDESRDQRETASKCLHSKRRAGRNIVILLDGTSNQYSQKPTNVFKLYQVLQVDNEQLVYYDSGIGTSLPPGSHAWGTIKRWTSVKTDLAFAWNFPEHVQNAYIYLMEHYQDGDIVFVFGFSRGAYTARCLIGMIEKMGLLPPGNMSQVPLAWKMYKSRKNDVRRGGKPTTSDQYKDIVGVRRSVNVHFLGVWDTVSSLGLFGSREYPFASSVTSVCYFRHALALNERRARFQPVFRQHDVPNSGIPCVTFIGPFGPLYSPREWKDVPRIVAPERGGGDIHPLRPVRSAELNDLRSVKRNKEVWFMGSHGDCGGGVDTVASQRSLSHIPFRWMLREAMQCGLKIDAAGFMASHALLSAVEDRAEVQRVISHSLLYQLERDRINEQDLRSLVLELNQRPFSFTDNVAERRRILGELLPPELLSDLVREAADRDETVACPDLNRPVADKLKQRRAWLILEVLPSKKRYQHGSGRRRFDECDYYDWGLNLGQGRTMLKEDQTIHRSVFHQMAQEQSNDPRGIRPTWTPPAGLLPGRMTWDALGSGAAIWENSRPDIALR